jgi:transcriptional regulator with GAF, ATPase, and Fis domain
MASGKSSTDQAKLWQGLDGCEQEIVLYLVHANSPISIDQLSALSGAPAVRVLNFMEHLRKGKIVHEKKEFGKGIYFLNGADLLGFLQSRTSADARRTVVQKMVGFYGQTMAEGNERTLVLAELYWKLGDCGDGLRHMKSAADILYCTGRKERADAYYDHLLKSLASNGATTENQEDFLDTVLGGLSVARHSMSLSQRIALLTTAESIARQSEKWECLLKIRLALGRVLQANGESKTALGYMNDAWELAKKIGNLRLLKMATLFTSEFLHLKGEFSEAVRRYEEVVEDLEEFGDDEGTLEASAMMGLCYVRCGRIARGMGMIDAVRVKANMLNFQRVIIFADVMTVLSLFEIRRIPEAERYLDRLSSLPEDVVGHYLLWPVEGCNGYVRWTKDDYEGAFERLKKAVDHARSVGCTHQNGAWNFDYLDALEAKGYVHETWNCDREIRRILNEDDIYMKGVSLRYRAQRNIDRNEPIGKIMGDLKTSEKYLKKAGAEIELARTRIELGNLYLKRGEPKLAQSYLERAWTLFSKVDKNLFPKDLLASMPPDQKIELTIDRMIAINESLGTVRDMSSFLERVINTAMDFTMATRGVFFVVGPHGEQSIVASRNLDPLLLKADQSGVIRDVVARVARQGTEFVMPGLSEKDGISDSSLVAAGITSLICMPVKLGSETHGYLYLDNRLGKRLFPENHLPYVRLICSQIAVGLSNIKIYDEMRERKDRFEDEAIFYKREMGIANPNEVMVGHSEGVKSVLDEIRQVAPTNSSVLITGETGVGKELVAKAIHNLSERKDGPFIPVNLAALPHELVTSELFGHEKGAFTGANEKTRGRFELAHGGTIFFDEIGDLPLTMQVKLLRVLQEGMFERLGSAKPIQSNFRVIAATNRDLHREVEKGAFRQDLYYRLNVFPIYVPPLRERRDDIPLIARHFIDGFSRQMGKDIRTIPGEELKKLLDYHWPGNVRELKHFVERAVILSTGNRISFSGLDHGAGAKSATEDGANRPLAEVEREYIGMILNNTHWRITGPQGAASILGLKPTTLIFRMKKLGIKRPSVHAT